MMYAVSCTVLQAGVSAAALGLMVEKQDLVDMAKDRVCGWEIRRLLAAAKLFPGLQVMRATPAAVHTVYIRPTND